MDMAHSLLLLRPTVIPSFSAVRFAIAENRPLAFGLLRGLRRGGEYPRGFASIVFIRITVTWNFVFRRTRKPFSLRWSVMTPGVRAISMLVFHDQTAHGQRR